LVGARAEIAAETVGALIDGVYIRQALRQGAIVRDEAVALVEKCVGGLIGEEK
jgi:TetR/AcrR family transcriptional repressor of bet genes